MLFDNDDFPQKYSINRCLSKLENSKDIIGCGGYLINFNLFNLKNKKNYLSGNVVNISKLNFGDNFNHPSAIKRLNFYLSKKKKINTVNDIFRTNILKKNYKILKNLKFKYIYFYFTVADLLNYYSGKIYKIKMPFIIHQHHPYGLSVKMKNIYETSANKNFLEQKKIVYKVIGQKIKNKKINDLLDKYYSEINKKSKIYKLKFKKINKIHILNKTDKFLKLNYQILKNKYLENYNNHTRKFVKTYKNRKLQKDITQTFNFIRDYGKI